MNYSPLALVAVLVGCNPEPADVEALEVEQQYQTLSGCIDDYFDCASPCGFDFACRAVCRDTLQECFDAVFFPSDDDTPTDEPTTDDTPTDAPAGSSSCTAFVSINGESQSVSCTDGDCTCSQNGVEVGTCSDTSCELPDGCCAEFF